MEHAEATAEAGEGNVAAPPELKRPSPEFVREAGVAPVKPEYIIDPTAKRQKVLAEKERAATVDDKLEGLSSAVGDPNSQATEKGDNVPAAPSVPYHSREAKKGFKKRGRDDGERPSLNLCKHINHGEDCPYGSLCRYSHDVALFLSQRPPDLEGDCIFFQKRGYCPFGFSCRFGRQHIDFEKKKIIRRDREEKKDSAEKTDEATKKGQKNGEDEEENLANYSGELNILSRKLQTSLRKKKYPFLCAPMKREKGAKVPEEEREERKAIVHYFPDPADTILLPEPKSIDFKGKIYIAPLTTVGNLPFRRILKHFGADITCGEMAMAQNLINGHTPEWALLKRHPCEDIFGVQIAGGKTDIVARAAELLGRETEIDFIDLNVGCPIDLVCDAGAGACLMNREKRLETIVRSVSAVLHLSTPLRREVPLLTVKMRTGWDNKRPLAHTLAPHVASWTPEFLGVSNPLQLPDSVKLQLKERQAASALTIHGRSRLQRYTKLADWNYIQQCSKAVRQECPDAKLQIIGNGDIISFTDWEQQMQTGAVDTCMLARGALMKEIKERRHIDISASERLDILKDFVRFGLEHWGCDYKGVNNTRRFLLEWLSFLCRYIPVGLLEVLPQKINDRPPPFVGRNDLETLMASKNPGDWIRISEMLLGPVPKGFVFVPKHKAASYDDRGHSAKGS